MTSPRPLLGGLLLAAAGLSLTACLNLSPAKDTARYFLLAAATNPPPAVAAAHPFALGIGKVRVPAYLLRDTVAVRQLGPEIAYLPNALWAERLDNGLQRVLAGDLALRLGTDRVRLSAWAKEDVQFEIYVTVDRFEVSADGRGECSAWWRILSPASEVALSSGQFHQTAPGPRPAEDPGGAVATLSQLAEGLGGTLAAALKQLPPPAAPAR